MKNIIIILAVLMASMIAVANADECTKDETVTPEVFMVGPYNGGTNVSTSPDIKFQFNEPVAGVSSNVMLYQSYTYGTQVAGGITIKTDEANTYVFSPASPLNEQTTYYLVLNSGITDIACDSDKRKHLSQYVFSFTTGRK